MSSLPSRAEVIIIGGGIIGCSIAYHLTKLGIRDVLLLERRQLTCGTTWHAAGLVPQLRATRTLTELAKYTSELLKTLEAETGQATGFKQNGSVAVALNAARFEEFKRTGAMGRAFGVEVDFLTPADVLAKYPLLSGKGVVGGLWTPNDGQTNSVDTTMAYAKGAKQGGARIFENTEVTDLVVENGHAVGVRAVHDGVECELRAPTVVHKAPASPPSSAVVRTWISRSLVVNSTAGPFLRSSTFARIGKVCRRSTMPATDCKAPSSWSCAALRTIMFLQFLKVVVVVGAGATCEERYFRLFDQGFSCRTTLWVMGWSRPPGLGTNRH